jgi:hypothetical protein
MGVGILALAIGAIVGTRRAASRAPLPSGAATFLGYCILAVAIAGLAARAPRYVVAPSPHPHPPTVLGRCGSKEVRVMRYATTAPARPRVGISWLGALYLIVGGIVAATHHYWSNLHTVKAVVSALLATVLWPLVLLGINLHVH